MTSHEFLELVENYHRCTVHNQLTPHTEVKPDITETELILVERYLAYLLSPRNLGSVPSQVSGESQSPMA